jgi:hypothetical protein
MQQRRFRPGDVLDDYCPRERRITDHAVVAMIDDRIKQTRCVVCDAEHEYKEGKVPPQRRKRPQAALFSQVLDGLQGGPQPAARLTHLPDSDPDHNFGVDRPDTVRPVVTSFAAVSGNSQRAGAVMMPNVQPPTPEAEARDAHELPDEAAPTVVREEGPVRRPLIRATLPRPEGQPVVARALPEFTIRQPHSGRSGGGTGGGGGQQRQGGGRRRGGHQQHAGQGGGQGGRFGRGGHGQSQRSPGGRQQGPHGRSGGPRRGGKPR